MFVGELRYAAIRSTRRRVLRNRRGCYGIWVESQEGLSEARLDVVKAPKLKIVFLEVGASVYLLNFGGFIVASSLGR